MCVYLVWIMLSTYHENSIIQHHRRYLHRNYRWIEIFLKTIHARCAPCETRRSTWNWLHFNCGIQVIVAHIIYVLEMLHSTSTRKLFHTSQWHFLLGCCCNRPKPRHRRQIFHFMDHSIAIIALPSFSTYVTHTYRCFIHERWNVFKFTDSVKAWSMCCITPLIHFGFAYIPFHLCSDYNKYSKLQCRTHSQSHPLHYVWVIVCVCAVDYNW